MRIQVGLRAEIILQVTLLLAAALLLGGILLLKYAERELLGQAVAHHSGTAEVLAGSLAEAGANGEPAPAARHLLEPMRQSGAVRGWALIERGGLISQSSGEVEPLAPETLRALILRGERYVEVIFRGAGIVSFAPPQAHLDIVVPFDPERFSGGVQLRFSLDSVHQRVLNGYRLLLIYVVLYGAVFIFFGAFLLNRSFIRPVRVLQESTHKVAAGELAHALAEEGPREVAELARDFNAMIEALRASRGETQATIETLRETISQLHQTRNDLVHAEKMASVGHLAAGMAHEIGNPLGALIGYLDFLRSELPPGSQEEIAGRALAEAQRIDSLVRELLDYAAPHKDGSERLDPAAVAREAADLLHHQGNLKGVALEMDLAPLPLVRISRHRLIQVLVNLLLNARDASAHGGRIRLRGGASGGFVTLSVTDEGTGIDPRSASHIFDPFFTTKPPGKGRGLGLSVCHRIVAESGGRIEVDSEPGRGSTFTVWLPQAGEGDDES